MNSSLSIRIGAPAQLTGSLPEQFNDDWLPGSHIINAAGGFGTIVAEQIAIHGIDLFYILGSLQQAVTLQIENTAPFFFLVVLLQGSYELLSERKTYTFNRQNCYSLAYFTRATISITLPGEGYYKSFVIAYPLSFMSSLLPFYPLLSDWLEKKEDRKNDISDESILPPLLAEKIYGLLHTPFVPLTEEYYYQVCGDIIRAVYNEHSYDTPHKVVFNQHDISCIHAAKEYMDAHILEHTTIAQLARKAGINRLKLKKGFKAIYGIGLYGYQLQQRLLIAKTALEKTNKPVHQIARQAGYRNASNFSIAFKRVYGSSPYQYRSKVHHG